MLKTKTIRLHFCTRAIHRQPLECSTCFYCWMHSAAWRNYNEMSFPSFYYFLTFYSLSESLLTCISRDDDDEEKKFIWSLGCYFFEQKKKFSGKSPWSDNLFSPIFPPFSPIDFGSLLLKGKNYTSTLLNSLVTPNP